MLSQDLIDIGDGPTNLSIPRGVGAGNKSQSTNSRAMKTGDKKSPNSGSQNKPFESQRSKRDGILNSNAYGGTVAGVSKGNLSSV